MNSREISIWIDERWYDALARHLKGDTLEERLEEFVDQLCNQLPEQEYERISQEIWQEDQVRQQEKEAARQFAVFHLVENGEHRYLQVERNLELLDAARMLRAYQKHSTIADSFSKNITWTYRKNFEEGKAIYRYKNWLGYRKGEDGEPEIVPEEAAIVERIFNMFLSGKSTQAIADTLADENIEIPGKTCASTVQLSKTR